MASNISNSQISVWIDATLKTEDIVNYKIEIVGSSEKGEGYASDVIFVNVVGTKKTNGKSAELDLVVKVGKNFSAIDVKQIKEAYEREIFLYDRIFPEFRKFEESKKIKDFFNCIPKCFKSFNDEKQVMVFENLRKQGYEPYDRMLPMNVDHIKLVLNNYAKFHSTSFAFRDQRRLEFESLIKNQTNLYKIFTTSTFKSLFQAGATKSMNTIKEIDTVLATKIDGVIGKDMIKILDQVLDIVVEESVVTHGDCWSSNFLFKYNNGNKTCPAKVAVLDWQVSSFHSPLMDISYFLFIVSSKDQVAEFDNLLEYYYENLCQNILEFGSDPRKLVPRSKFIEQWKIFSTFGYFLTLAFLDIILCDKDDAPSFAEYESEEELISATANITAKNKEMFLERIMSLSRYYFNLVEK